MFFCFGLAFEVPVAVVLLVLMGIVRIEKRQGAPAAYVLIGIFISQRSSPLPTPSRNARSPYRCTSSMKGDSDARLWRAPKARKPRQGGDT